VNQDDRVAFGLVAAASCARPPRAPEAAALFCRPRGSRGPEMRSSHLQTAKRPSVDDELFHSRGSLHLGGETCFSLNWGMPNCPSACLAASHGLQARKTLPLTDWDGK